jgi:hypothetical protein
MFRVEILGGVNNIDAALETIRSFEGDGGSAGVEPSEYLRAILARLPDNPERNICLWLLDVTLQIMAPASWWNQLKQYELDIFLIRRKTRDDRERVLLVSSDFEGSISEEKLGILNNYIRDGQYDTLQRLLPLNFIRSGFVKVCYKSLSQIYSDKREVPDDHWVSFLEFLKTLPYEDLIARQ